MKRLLILLFLVFTISGYSQTNNSSQKLVEGSWFWFKEYKRQFVSLKDSSSYVIIPIEGFSKKELFDKMMLGLNNVYMDISKVVSTVGNDAITVNAYHQIESSPFKLGEVYYHVTGFNCRFSFKFKDGKLRVDAPFVSTFDAHHFLNKEKTIHGNFSDFDNLSGICVGVYDALERIIDAAYNSKKDDDW